MPESRCPHHHPAPTGHDAPRCCRLAGHDDHYFDGDGLWWPNAASHVRQAHRSTGPARAQHVAAAVDALLAREGRE